MNRTDQQQQQQQQERNVMRRWLDALGRTRQPQVEIAASQQGWGKLRIGRSVINQKLRLAGTAFDRGFGTHADGEIVLRSPLPLRGFRARVGIDDNPDAARRTAPLRFSVHTAGRNPATVCDVMPGDAPAMLAAELDNVLEFTLKVTGPDPRSFGHADWADPEVVTADGEIIALGDPTAIDVATLPLSFVYGGTGSEECFRRWGVQHRESRRDDINVHLFTSSDPDTGLTCEMELEEYPDPAACLWNVRFTNTGKTPTPILTQVASLDLKWAYTGLASLYRARGAFNYLDETTREEAFRDDFMLHCDHLKQPVVIGGVGGRSSVDWMPYFNFQGEDAGLIFGIGWTGQWRAEISSDGDVALFRAGLEHLHTTLLPGESIRLPAILMIYRRSADPQYGHNQLRRLIRDRLAPRNRHGERLTAPVSNLTWGGMTAAEHLRRIRNLTRENLPFDYYWIDAGWYGQAGPNMDEAARDWSLQTGDWEINRDTFPHGLREVSDAVHASGRKFLLWVEPERAVAGTPPTLAHPERYLRTPFPDANLLLNLGLPEARQWCTELIAGLISDQGLDCYRQDFNFSPLPYWLANDAPDRVGITEIRYIEGLYTFLGELRRRFPDLLIDNCASGGRRLDFEMMRYSIPLWSSDMQCSPGFVTERNQQQVQGLSLWLPHFALGAQDHPGDTYNFRSAMAAGISIHLFTYERCPLSDDFPYAWLRDRLAEYHRAKIYFTGDFYPLLEQTASPQHWTAWQFHRPDLDAGILMVFRKNGSPIEKARFPLRALRGTDYELEDADTGPLVIRPGSELSESGLPVEIAARRDCRLIFYRAAADPAKTT